MVRLEHIKIIIGDKELELSPDEAKELREILDSIMPRAAVSREKEIVWIPYTHPYPYRYPYATWTYWTVNTSGTGDYTISAGNTAR